eukprot:TRINITY_DN5700_c1_g1_i1.p1 TRINITY_DN5700_c1_g1~~TRINITY_DN5700_c1_g1_i1.p1  ORF type:complete len:1189 (+),score=234.43 TRINITY_DN5700_c1_g1_i1:145-3711(+)
MELRVVESKGFEGDCILSIRCGGLRRQSNLSSQKPLGFPVTEASEIPMKVDVYKPVGNVELSVNAEERVLVRFPTAPGLPPKALTMQLAHSSDMAKMSRPFASSPFPSGPGSESRPGTSMTLERPGTVQSQYPVPRAVSVNSMNSEVSVSKASWKQMVRNEKQQGAVANAQSYLERHSLLPVLQELLCHVLREKPDNPWSFLSGKMAAREQGVPQAQGQEEKLPSMAEQPAPEAPPVQQPEAPQEEVAQDPTEVAREVAKQGLKALELSVLSRAPIQGRIDRLRPVVERLKSEAERVRHSLAEMGVKPERAPPPPKDEEFPVLSWVPEGSTAATQELARRFGTLLAEHESRCAEVARLTLQYTKAVARAAAAREGLEKRMTQLKSYESVSILLERMEKQAQALHVEPIDNEWECLDDSEDDSEGEEKEQQELAKTFKEITRKRGRAVSAEAYGAWNNRRAAFVPPRFPKTDEQNTACIQAFHNCPLFSHVELFVIETVVRAMPLEPHQPGETILKQGEDGDSLFILLEGKVDLYDDRSNNRYITSFKQGRIFGELAMLYSVPRSLTITCDASEPCLLARLNRAVYQNLIVRHQMRERERSEECLKQANMLETLNAGQVSTLCDVLDRREFKAGENIVQQGEQGDEFFIMMRGECAAFVETVSLNGEDPDVQEHRRYKEGDLFGERALLTRTTRAATVKALVDSEVLCLSRRKFERLLGPLSLLQRTNYTADPRKSISDFYKTGDSHGPAGSCKLRDPAWSLSKTPKNERTNWFAVYRPTSREAIAKMLSGAAVGKGLNVKGKSAKRGRVSGFVPFLQISNNADKALLAKPKLDARVKIFFYSDEERQRMLDHFEKFLDPVAGVPIQGDRIIYFLDKYEDSYGLDIPETVLREVYINSPDITFQAGWDTGRKSEPAFMDMNFAALRSDSKPLIVLYQADKQDPLNPHGLLLAYAEATVKPVVSDFDTFMVGCRGTLPSALPPNQIELEAWALSRTEEILDKPGLSSWTSRWLQVMQTAQEQGFYPKTPPWGFGDSASYRLIGEAIQATKETGAIRHGAECFNFYFPQELDEEYLVVWEGFQKSQLQQLDEMITSASPKDERGERFSKRMTLLTAGLDVRGSGQENGSRLAMTTIIEMVVSGSSGCVVLLQVLLAAGVPFLPSMNVVGRGDGSCLCHKHTHSLCVGRYRA